MAGSTHASATGDAGGADTAAVRPPQLDEGARSVLGLAAHRTAGMAGAPIGLVGRPSVSPTAEAWRRFRRHKMAVVSLVVLGLFQGASWTRYVRSAVLDVVRLDYVTTARAKGLNERVVVMKHVVRNALIPVVTLVALQMPAVFGGAIVTEQIFRIPGIGSLLIDAILRNDTPVIMAVTFVFSCLVILFNLIADLLYGWLDPRISYR